MTFALALCTIVLVWGAARCVRHLLERRRTRTRARQPHEDLWRRAAAGDLRAADQLAAQLRSALDR